jgi:hypothetical protein
MEVTAYDSLWFCTNLLTPWSRTLLEKLKVAQLVRKYHSFMEPKGSSPCSQKTTTATCPEIVCIFQVIMLFNAVNFISTIDVSIFCSKLYIYKKVKLSLCLTKHYAVKTYWEMEVELYAFLISALGGGEWSASRPGRFTLRVRAPGTHWIGGWAGPRAVLDAVVKRKIPSPHRKSNPRTPIVQPVA